jgi:hypothetical protein
MYKLSVSPFFYLDQKLVQKIPAIFKICVEQAMYVLSYVCVFLPTVSTTNGYSGMYDQKAIVVISTTTLGILTKKFTRKVTVPRAL